MAHPAARSAGSHNTLFSEINSQYRGNIDAGFYCPATSATEGSAEVGEDPAPPELTRHNSRVSRKYGIAHPNLASFGMVR